MYKDIRLHGSLENKIEYYAIAAGVDAHKRYFFNVDQSSEAELRFFSTHNEFVVGQNEIKHRGNGGSFCEYMFGVDQPLTETRRQALCASATARTALLPTIRFSSMAMQSPTISFLFTQLH